ncbi:Epidermal growth factor receptor kinase substrate 8 [Trichoplax sp. H2]|nr:Epidermal growth factor receptor kinase substrate 8 [Trichoplax sp. H2]|eukprot:RDD39778.1 Epidermal growth factor receptor kinase substrate 8 [Trichoplax sp. H2]
MGDQQSKGRRSDQSNGLSKSTTNESNGSATLSQPINGSLDGSLHRGETLKARKIAEQSYGAAKFTDNNSNPIDFNKQAKMLKDAIRGGQKKKLNPVSGNPIEINFTLVHLTTAKIDPKTYTLSASVIIDDLKGMKESGDLYFATILMKLDAAGISVIEINTQSLVEQLPFTAVERCEFMENVPEFDQLLLLFTNNNDGTHNFHIFRTLDAKASTVCNEIKGFPTKIAKEEKLNGRRLSNGSVKSDQSNHSSQSNQQDRSLHPSSSNGSVSNGLPIIPPPPPESALPQPPSNGRVNGSVPVLRITNKNESENKRISSSSDDQSDSKAAVSPRGGLQLGNEAVNARVENNIKILNHCIDDVESFVKKLSSIHQARSDVLDRRSKKKTKKDKIKDADKLSENVYPDDEKFKDCFQKMKMGLNYAVLLKRNLQKPTPIEIIQYLVDLLLYILKVPKALDIAANVVSPLFTVQTLQTVKASITPKQEQAIQSLGSAWNLSRDQYPDANLVPVYYPVFSDGWVPKDVKNPHWAKLSKDIKRLVNIAAKTPKPQQTVTIEIAGRTNSAAQIKGASQIATVKADYNPTTPGFLAVKTGEKCEVIEKTKDGWLVHNINSGKQGLVPSKNLEVAADTVLLDGGGGLPVNAPPPPNIPPPPVPATNSKKDNTNDPILFTAPPPPPISPPAAPLTAQSPAPPPAPAAPLAPPAPSAAINGALPPPPPPPPPAPVFSKTDSKLALVNALKNPQLKKTTTVKYKASDSDLLQDELKARMKMRRIQSRNRNEVGSINPNSSKEEIRQYLTERNFSAKTTDLLGDYGGFELLSLTKEELAQIAPGEENRLHSLLTTQRSQLPDEQQKSLQDAAGDKLESDPLAVQSSEKITTTPTPTSNKAEPEWKRMIMERKKKRMQQAGIDGENVPPNKSPKDIKINGLITPSVVNQQQVNNTGLLAQGTLGNQLNLTSDALAANNILQLQQANANNQALRQLAAANTQRNLGLTGTRSPGDPFTALLAAQQLSTVQRNRRLAGLNTGVGLANPSLNVSNLSTGSIGRSNGNIGGVNQLLQNQVPNQATLRLGLQQNQGLQF